MFRKCVFGLVMFLFCGGILLAETFTGKLDKMDADKNTGIVRDDKNLPHPFKVDGDTKFLDADGKEVKDGYKGFKEGDQVSVTTTGKGKKTKTTEVKQVKKSSDNKNNN